jgi:hypothetical protein
MSYKIEKVTVNHHHLWFEYNAILDACQLDPNDVFEVYCLYHPKEIPQNLHSHISFHKAEKYMYRTAIATSYCVMREELELPIMYDDYEYSYLILDVSHISYHNLLDKPFIVARYGTYEVDYQLDEIHLFPWLSADLKNPYVTLGTLLEESKVFQVLYDQVEGEEYVTDDSSPGH